MIGLPNMKPIADFPGYYVTATGEVWSDKSKSGRGKGKLHKLKGRYDKSNRHLRVGLLKNGRQFNRPIHQLVAKAFLVKPAHSQCVRHLNDDPTNNQVDNLTWGTFTENAFDALRNERKTVPSVQKGENHHLTHLMPLDVLCIRERKRRGQSGSDIAKLYRITVGSVSAIHLRKTWKHLP